MDALGIRHLFTQPNFGGFSTDYCNPVCALFVVCSCLLVTGVCCYCWCCSTERHCNSMGLWRVDSAGRQAEHQLTPTSPPGFCRHLAHRPMWRRAGGTAPSLCASRR